MTDTCNSAPILMKPRQAAKELGVPEHWLRAELRAGRIPHLKAGSHYLVDINLTIRKIHEMSGHSVE